jgi:ferredoxin
VDDLSTLQVLGQLKCGSAATRAQVADVTATCWASHAVDHILTGHEDGTIVHWRLRNGSFTRCQQFAVTEEEPRDAIHSLSMVLGTAMSVVVFGGNMAEAPRSVSLIHVARAEVAGVPCPGAQKDVVHVPWFGKLQGFALVRPRGSLRVHDEPSAVVTLTQGGYLCIHDIASAKTEPFVGAFQSRAIVHTDVEMVRRRCATCMACVARRVPPARWAHGSVVQRSLLLAALRSDYTVRRCMHVCHASAARRASDGRQCTRLSACLPRA